MQYPTRIFVCAFSIASPMFRSSSPAVQPFDELGLCAMCVVAEALPVYLKYTPALSRLYISLKQTVIERLL